MGKIFTEKRKKDLVIFLILWLVLAIVFVLPAAVAAIDSTEPLTGEFKTPVFIDTFFSYILDINSRVKAFQEHYIANTGKVMKYYVIIYWTFAIILMLKAKKGDFYDIEHGSSDWSVGGEQYKVLSKKEGIILAEKNYLPVDKKGNVNVLIVGRIWCW